MSARTRPVMIDVTDTGERYVRKGRRSVRVYRKVPIPKGPLTTPPKRCMVLIPSTAGLPEPCGGVRFKAGRCAEHYTDWRNAREARGIAQREYRAKQIAANKLNAHGRVTPLTVRVPFPRKLEKRERQARGGGA